jgi:hypothetical protein
MSIIRLDPLLYPNIQSDFGFFERELESLLKMCLVAVCHFAHLNVVFAVARNFPVWVLS